MIFSRFKWGEKILELENPSRAYTYYRHYRMNHLTGFPEAYPVERLLDGLSEVSLQDEFRSPRIYHFYYDLGLLLAGLSLGSDELPLAVELEYHQPKLRSPRASNLSQVKLKSLERPTWTEYREAFQRIQAELQDGNCYQVNLTYPYDFETDDLIDPRDLADYFFSSSQTSAFAHCSFLGEEMILSNTPECLFQFAGGKLRSMPIKGTEQLTGPWRGHWQRMQEDRKQEGELFMITDLMKNDMNQIDGARSRVKKLRAPLVVPGLLHQYSEIELEVRNEVSLLKVVKALFPGGSITGAPKKRVMQIIQAVERYDRGIYCGSTLLCWQGKKTASINIRTASIAPFERMWRYGAGGGVTLLSKAHEEYREMEAKVASFLTMLKK